MNWACVVITVTSRRKTTLPRTLASMRAAGFPDPRLCVDNCTHAEAEEYANEFKLEVTSHWPTIRTVGNWCLAIREALVRNPLAERFIVANDDAVFCRGCREYIDRTTINRRNEYFNLYSFRDANETIIRSNPPGWYEASYVNETTMYCGKLAQTGRGALALVFDRDGVVALLSHIDFVNKPLEPGHKGWSGLDGAVVNAMNKSGYREMISSPSLTQHIGDDSELRKFRPEHPVQKKALSFRSENWDAMSLLR